jgi:hypothetical protein
MSDATIRSVTLQSSITTLERSLPIIDDVYCIGITFDDRNMFIVHATGVNFVNNFFYIMDTSDK